MKTSGNVTLFALFFSVLLAGLAAFHLFFTDEFFRLLKSKLAIQKSEELLKNAITEIQTGDLPNYFCNKRICVLNSAKDNQTPFIIGDELADKTHFPKINFDNFNKTTINCPYNPRQGTVSKATCTVIPNMGEDLFLYGNLKQHSLTVPKVLFITGALFLESLEITQPTLIAALEDINIKHIAALTSQPITLYSATGAVSVDRADRLIKLRVLTWKRGIIPTEQLSDQGQITLPLIKNSPLMLIPYEAE